MTFERTAIFATALLVWLPAAHAAAGEPTGAPQVAATATPAVPASSGGGVEAIIPPPPQPPAVITRAQSGLATMRAVRVSQPLKIDGRLDEEVYDGIRTETPRADRLPPFERLIASRRHLTSQRQT